jgi:asparagine synthase (glutamine-hydrolysing)
MRKDEQYLFGALREQFAAAVNRNRGEGALFSGGLDSALVAACSGACKAVSVHLGSYGEDRRYAERVAAFLGLDHCPVTVTVEEALAALPEVVQILKSFDPALPNDVTVYLGLRRAREMGIKDMMTGDGSDELFAGYEFMQKIPDLEKYLTQMHAAMEFSSNAIGEALGIEIRQPFLDRAFVDFSHGIDLDLKIGEEQGERWGKWILRKAFEGVLPREILWQGKRSLEYGSGMTGLREVIESLVSDEEFEEGTRVFPVRFWNKEHFYYYRIYRDVVGEVALPDKGEERCGCCGAGMPRGALHCKICGEVVQWEGRKN